MALDTKLSLSNQKFEQHDGESLQISGHTIIFGNISYGVNKSGTYGPRSIPDVAYVTGLTSTISGNTGVVTFENGLQRDGSVATLGGILDVNTDLRTSGNTQFITFVASGRLGVGTASPAATVDVKAPNSDDTEYGLIVRKGDTTKSLSIRNDGLLSIFGQSIFTENESDSTPSLLTRLDVRGVSGGTILRLATHIGSNLDRFIVANTGFITHTPADVTGVDYTLRGGLTASAPIGNKTSLKLNPIYNLTNTYNGTVYGIDYNPTLTSISSGASHYALRTTSGSILFGNNSTVTSIPGVRLDVRGTGTSTGNAVRVSDSVGNARFTVQDNGVVTLQTLWALNSATVLQVRPGAGGAGIFHGLEITPLSGYANTSGQYNALSLRATALMASGSAGFTSLNVSPTLNTSGSYSGISRGIYYAPTLTSTLGLTHIAFENTSGEIRLGGITQDNDKSQILAKDGTTNKLFWRDAASIGTDTGDYWKVSGTTSINSADAIINVSPNKNLSFHHEDNFIWLGDDFEGPVLLASDGTGNTFFSVRKNTIGIFSTFTNFQGLTYDSNYSSGFTKYSLVDVNYVTGITSTISANVGNGLSKDSGTIVLGGGLTTDTTITATGSTHTNTISLGQSAFNAALNVSTEYNDGFTMGSTTLEVKHYNGTVLSFDNLNGEFNQLKIGSSGIEATSNGDNFSHYAYFDVSNSNQYGKPDEKPQVFQQIVEQDGTVNDVLFSQYGFDVSMRNAVGDDLAKFIITKTGTTFTDGRITPYGIQYSGNYASTFAKHSLVDKNYVTGLTSTISTGAANGLTKNGTNIELGGTITKNTSITGFPLKFAVLTGIFEVGAGKRVDSSYSTLPLNSVLRHNETLTNGTPNFYLSSTINSDHTITGIQLSDGNIHGLTVRLMNDDAVRNITLANRHTGSTASNRFDFNRNIVLKPKESLTVWYDSRSSFWRVYNNVSNTPQVVTQSIEGSVVIDLRQGDVFILNMSGDTTFNFTGETIGRQYVFKVIKDSTEKTFTWVSGRYRFPFGTAPVLTNPTTNGSSPAHSEDIITAICTSSGRLDIVTTPDLIEN